MSDLASVLQNRLRSRAIEGPSGAEMLSQVMMLPLGARSTLGSARANSTPEAPLAGRTIEDTTALIRQHARDVAAQAQRDYYTQMAAQATGHATRSGTPKPIDNRTSAVREFESMQPPPRSQMHGLATPAGGLAAYLQNLPEGPY